MAPDCLSLQDFPPAISDLIYWGGKRTSKIILKGETSNIYDFPHRCWRISSVTWHMGNAQKTSVNHPNEKEKSSYRKKRE